MLHPDLTEKERRFVAAYVGPAAGNGSQSAVRAGYKPSSAHWAALKVMRRPHVRAAITREQEHLAKKFAVTQERVIQELARIAFFDARTLFDAHDRLKPLRDLDDDCAAVIAGVDIAKEQKRIVLEPDAAHGLVVADITTERVTKIRLAEKNSALVSLCRTLGLFKDKINLSFDIEDLFKREPQPLEDGAA